MRRAGLLAVLALAALAAGCATSGRHFTAHLESASMPLRDCAEWYRALDQQIDAAGVRDAQYARVPGFPYLRVDRFNASLLPRATTSEASLQGLAERLLDLELESRHHELRNLPQESLAALPFTENGATGSGVFRRTAECARLLREIDLAKVEARAGMVEAIHAPDDYSTASRFLGLYPLTRIVFSAGVKRWESETVAGFRGELPALSAGTVVRYAPPQNTPLQRGTVAGILGRAEFDPLGVPSLSPRELAQVAAAYAPTFEILISGDHDRFGRLRWPRGAAVPEVDASEAAVYVHPAYTRYGGRVLLQLVYHVWFPERPAQSEADLLAGRLDGIVWRVTLAPDGDPLIYDSIHPCGCYHVFFPTPRANARPAPDSLEEWAFVPQRLPAVAEGERPVVRVASRTHYIEQVTLTRGGDSIARYVFRPYDELRSLPTQEGGARSLFRTDGHIAGTERAERYFFWPMGIASAGAMRQWGRHATAFIGRRHFDDPDLLEKRFELDLGERLP